MLATLEQNPALLTTADARRPQHLLVVLPRSEGVEKLARVPFVSALQAALKRRKKKLEDLRKSPITTDAGQGALVSWVMHDADKSVFERQTLLRKSLQPLLAE